MAPNAPHPSIQPRRGNTLPHRRSAGTGQRAITQVATRKHIDAGSNGAVPADSADLDGDGDTSERAPVDLDGNPRFVDDPVTADTGVSDPPDYTDIVDMGAYEFFLDCNENGIPDELEPDGDGDGLTQVRQ